MGAVLQNNTTEQPSPQSFQVPVVLAQGDPVPTPRFSPYLEAHSKRQKEGRQRAAEMLCREASDNVKHDDFDSLGDGMLFHEVSETPNMMGLTALEMECCSRCCCPHSYYNLHKTNT